MAYPGSIYISPVPWDPERAATVVQAKPFVQHGVPILVGQCPRCGYRFGITRRGKVMTWCAKCDLWVRFVEG